ncbi:MAG: hypothetical protein C0485_18610 [Pirellula sp.]|nr:hypothetical protein [Pirellula sp.]
MSDAELQVFEPTDAASPTTPGMRFPLRAMLLVTSGAALLAAGLGPAYRAAAPESRATLLAFWLTLLAVLFGNLWFQWWGHAQRLARAGPIRFTLQRPDLRNYSLIESVVAFATFLVSLLILLSSLVMACVFTLELVRRAGGPGIFGAMYAAGVIGFLMDAAIYFLYRPFAHMRPILLGEQGVVVRRRVLPWASFKRASWHHLLPNWLMLYGSERAYAAAAPEAIKSDIEAFVRTKTRFEKDERKLAPGH